MINLVKVSWEAVTRNWSASTTFRHSLKQTQRTTEIILYYLCFHQHKSSGNSLLFVVCALWFMSGDWKCIQSARSCWSLSGAVLTPRVCVWIYVTELTARFSKSLFVVSHVTSNQRLYVHKTNFPVSTKYDKNKICHKMFAILQR